MRLLLDEHYSPKIAEQLRKRGHDVASVNERDDLRGLGDRELWNLASAEGRALVTENAADFMPLVRQAAAAGEPHFGVVFTSTRVEQLEGFLRDRPADDALVDQVHWLRGGSPGGLPP